MSHSLLRPALVLGLLSCIGPFAIDMYLPAMPEIARDLGSTAQAMQGTITAYFIAFGLSQLLYGPWADQAGRKLPIYVGTTIFLLGTLICAAAPDAGWLLAGAGVMALVGWRGIFAMLAVAAGISLLMTRFLLEETLPPEHRQPVDLAALRRGAWRLLTDRGFMVLTFLGAFGFASFFIFIASASFVYTQSFGLSPVGFSLAFAVNAIGFFAASQFAAGLGMRFGAPRVIALAALGFALCTAALFALGLAGWASLPVTMAGLFLANGFLGLIIPTVMVMALDDHGDIAGLASSLGGTLQMLTGGVIVAALGPFFDGSVLPMLAAIALCGAVTALLSRLIGVRQAPAASGAA